MESVEYTYGKHTNGKITKRDDSIVGIRTGKFCMIEPESRLIPAMENENIVRQHPECVTSYLFGHYNTDIFDAFGDTKNRVRPGMVIVGNDVRIGYDVIIKSGVTIGNGAVVSSYSRLYEDVLPYSIVHGNPTEHEKFRFNPEQIAQLEIIKWWDWEDEKINRFLPLLCGADIDAFIEAALADEIVSVKNID